MWISKCTRNIFIFSTITFSHLPVHSQNKPYNEVSIASPTAGSLGKYADIPVNYHTGIPQIGLPIYTIKAGPLELPISLSYHASGLKVQEPASWIGAGWALNAGGVITRSVMGAPDERGTGTNQNQTWGHYSDYGYNTYLYNGPNQDWQGVANGARDGEPDLFFFNFAGYSGKFYFRDDRTAVLVPQQDLQIVAGYPGTGSIQSFIITTPDGIQYIFGNSGGTTGANPVEITNPYTANAGMAQGTAISSWYLNKILSADSQFQIKLNYTSENYGYHSLAMFPIDGTVNSTYPNGTVYEYDLVKNIVQGVRLSQVTFPNGSINFIAGSVRTDLSNNASTLIESVNQNATTLGSIQILNEGTIFKKFNFSYGYFVDNTTPVTGRFANAGYNLQTDKMRLRLDNIQETSGDGTINIPAHKFSYYPEMVPRRLSFALDHWGFINGVSNNQTLIPTYTLIQNNTPNTISGANRDASWPAMRGGALNQITYPTGGYTLFDFESNDTYTSGASSQYILGTLINLRVHLPGNSLITQTVPFTTTGTDNIELTVINSSTGWSPVLSIKNSGNTEVYNSFSIPVSSTSTNTLSLPPGAYQATLSFPSNSLPNLDGGAEAILRQWQYQTTTTSGNTRVGGLRIKTITHNDGLMAQNNMVTSYSYVNGTGNSNGILYSRPVYVQQLRNDLVKTLGYWNPVTGYVPNSLNPNGCPVNGLYYKSGGSIRPMSTSQGNHIGYSQVKVSQSGNGYSVYNYYINNSGYGTPTGDVAVRSVIADISNCDAATPNYPAAPLPFDYKRGELYYEQHYNNTGALLKDVYYYPEYDEASVISTPGFIVATRGVGLLGTNYSLSSPRRTKTTTYETNYDGPSMLTITTTYYGSRFHNKPTRKVVTTSKGDSLINNLKYAYDFRVPDCDAISDCSGSYTSGRTTCQTQYISSSFACGGASSCLTTAYLAYQKCLATARISYVTCRKTNFTNFDNAFKKAHNKAKDGANVELKPILELQDVYNNAAIEVSNWTNNKLTGASFTKFDYSSNPLNKVYPAIILKINLAGSSSTFLSSTNTNSTVTKDSRYVNETSLKYYSGNLAEVLPKAGVYSSYIWGNNNNLPIVKATGVNQSTLLAAYSAVGGNLSLLRSQPTLANAQVFTYTYRPLIGMTSETNPQGIVTSYEYDALGRLSLIRDKNNNVIKKIFYSYSGNP